MMQRICYMKWYANIRNAPDICTKAYTSFEIHLYLKPEGQYQSMI